MQHFNSMHTTCLLMAVYRAFAGDWTMTAVLTALVVGDLLINTIFDALRNIPPVIDKVRGDVGEDGETGSFVVTFKTKWGNTFDRPVYTTRDGYMRWADGDDIGSSVSTPVWNAVWNKVKKDAKIAEVNAIEEARKAQAMLNVPPEAGKLALVNND